MMLRIQVVPPEHKRNCINSSMPVPSMEVCSSKHMSYKEEPMMVIATLGMYHTCTKDHKRQKGIKISFRFVSRTVVKMSCFLVVTQLAQS